MAGTIKAKNIIANGINPIPSDLPKLNLPEYPFIYSNDDKNILILDELRKKFLKLTPEEWIRQNFVKFLINNLKYPASFIKIEQKIKLDNLTKRCDIIIYDKNLYPYMVVECKNTKVEISQMVINQIGVYNSKLKAPFIVITNGNNHIIFNTDFDKGKIQILQNFPEYKKF